MLAFLVSMLSSLAQEAPRPPAVAVLHEVEVVGERPVDPHSSVGALTVIDLTQAAGPGRELADAFVGRPGLIVRRMGGPGDLAQLAVRGTSTRHVEVLVDGVPLNPDGSGGVDLSELPLGLFGSAIVHRGAAPLRTGSAAMGGVVALRSAEAGAPARVWASGGSLGTVRGGVTGGVPVAGGQLNAGLDAFRSGGSFLYLDDRGTVYTAEDDLTLRRENNQKGQTSGQLRWVRPLPSGRLTASASGLARAQGIPGPIGAPTPGVGWRAARGLTSLTAEASGARGEGTLGLWGLARQEHLRDPERALGRSATHTVTVAQSAGLRGGGALSVAPGLSAAGNLDLRAEALGRAADVGEPTAYLRLASRLGAGLVWAPEALAVRVEGGVVGSALRASAGKSGPSAPLVALDPRLGAVWRPTDRLSVRGGVVRALRPPDLSELFSDQGAVAGRPDLRPERALQRDVGLRWDFGSAPAAAGPPRAGGSLEVAAFQTDSEDLIVWVQNAQRQVFPVNLDAARIRGLEAGGELRWGAVAVGAGLTWSQSENRSEDGAYSGARLPRLPLLDAAVRAAWEGDRARLLYDLQLVSGTFEDATNWYVQPPRRLHGAGASVRVGGAWWVSAEARNLTDHRAHAVPVNPLDPSDSATVTRPITDFSGFPLAGRTAFVGLAWAEAGR